MSQPPACLTRTGGSKGERGRVEPDRGKLRSTPQGAEPLRNTEVDRDMDRAPAGIERDDEEDDDGLPSGTKNYITPQGHRSLVQELDHLWREERPKVVEVVSWAAGNGDRSENGDYLYGKKRLREIDRRIRFLRKRIEKSEIVDPTIQKDRSRVYFGATVIYADLDGPEQTVTIVGVDETDFEAGRISWISPVARALLRAEVGDTVVVRSPAGPRELEVIAITYDAGGTP